MMMAPLIIESIAYPVCLIERIQDRAPGFFLPSVKRCCIIGQTSPGNFHIHHEHEYRKEHPLSEKSNVTVPGDHTSMPHLPTGTVTLLFTDVEGSTRLLQQLGEHYSKVLADCRHLLRSMFQQYNGHEVDTQGDAFFVAFARATDAVAAAAAIQRALVEHSWPSGTSVRVRIGLHTGEPMLTADGYIGMDVHHAARIMSAGHGGQILLSPTTRQLVEQHLPAGTYLQDLGEHRLKDLQRDRKSVV